MEKGLLRDVRHYLLINRSNLFNEKYYLDTYLDVKISKVNPLWHFVRFGWKEGRNPSENFDTKYYLKKYEDVRNLHQNPLVHYILYGSKESREIRPLENMSSSQQRKLDQVFICIIIPVMSPEDDLLACIEAICANGEKNYDIEIMVVYNSSDENVGSLISQVKKKFSGFVAISFGENEKYGAAVNFGLKMSRSEFVVILNPNTIPSSGWLDRLLQALLRDELLGIVSPITNFGVDNVQIDRQSKGLQVDEINCYSTKIVERSTIYEAFHLSFFCVMMRGVLKDIVGYLEENYSQVRIQEEDYCLRVVNSGFKLGVVRNAFVLNKADSSGEDYQYSEDRESFYLKAGRIAVTRRDNGCFINYLEKPKVSIITRTKNRRRQLKHALNSLENQRSDSFEVIIVNDGGDEINDIVTQYNKVIPIKYIHHINSTGRTHALNTGLSMCDGEWIAILDDDDIYYPWFIQTMLQAIQRWPEIKFFYGQYNRVLIDLERQSDPISISECVPYNFSRKSLLVANQIPINTWFFSKEMIRSCGGFDESFEVLEDYEFLLKISQSFPFKRIDRIVSEYRFYSSQLNSIFNNRERFGRAMKRIYDRYPSENKKMEDKRNKSILLYQEQCRVLEEIQEQLESLQGNESDELLKKIYNIVGVL